MTLKRVSILVVLAAIVGAGLAGGGSTSPEPTVYRFLLDWEQGQYAQAASLTTGNPTAVKHELAGAYAQLDATNLVLSMTQVRQHGDTATASFQASVDLGSNGHQWTYWNTFELQESGSTWRVVWSPAVIHAGLTGRDRLAVFQAKPHRAQLYAAGGQPLLMNSLTYEIGVVPRQLHGVNQIDDTASRLATALDLPAATAGQIAGQIQAAVQDEFLELVTLSPAQYAKVAKAVNAIPSLTIAPTMQRLYKSIAPDVVGAVGTETAAVLRQDGIPYRPGATRGLSGLQEAYQNQLTGTPDTGVIIQSSHGTPLQYLKRWSGDSGKKVTTTLSYGLQQAANQALGTVPGSAAIVAVQASSGKILAVASHQAANMPALQPLTGNYQPGQTFMIVSSAAMLATRQVQPGSIVNCPAANSANGSNFVNVPPEPARMARKATFSEDFARGCSTAFAGLSELLSGTDLARAAGEFGIGTPWQLPISAFGGTLGQPGGEGGLAANAIGQGGVRVSPLSMALAAATVDTGRWRAPSLITGTADPAGAAKNVMSTQVLTQLQSLMATAVPPGSAAYRSGNVYGEAGTAPFRTHGQMRISWFVGYQGDVAFAVAELVNSPTDSAAPLAGSFLRDIPPGS